MTRGLALAFLLLAAAPLAAAPQDRAVRLADGRVLNFWCEGSAGPAVVLDAGWGADSRAWGRVIAALKGEYRVCAMDRAGQGRSDPGPLPRDAAAIADDLAAALEVAKAPRPGPDPVILVGHSLGALHMRAFAMRYPARVAGMVLVDPSVPGVGSVAGVVARADRCLKAARAGSIPIDDPVLARCTTRPPEKAATRWEARHSEIQSMEGDTAALLAKQAAGSVPAPVIVLTAARGREGPGLAPWQMLHRATAAISSLGEQRTVPESGHMMMFDAPEAIVAAVRDIAQKNMRRPETVPSGAP